MVAAFFMHRCTNHTELHKNVWKIKDITYEIMTIWSLVKHVVMLMAKKSPKPLWWRALTAFRRNLLWSSWSCAGLHCHLAACLKSDYDACVKFCITRYATSTIVAIISSGFLPSRAITGISCGNWGIKCSLIVQFLHGAWRPIMIICSLIPRKQRWISNILN